MGDRHPATDPKVARRYLVVRGRGAALRLALPSLGTLTIGSGERADVRIAEPGIAPEHAELFLDHGIGLRLVDGEGEGAILPPPARAGRGPGRERPLTPGATVDLELGARVRLGSAELSFVTTPEVVPAPRAVARAYLERRLAAALVEDERPALAVLRIRALAATAPADLEARIAGGLRPADLMSRLAEDEYAVLLGEVTEATARGIAGGLGQHLAGGGAEVAIGMALASQAGARPLLELAAERLARPGAGGDRPGVYVSSDPEMLKVARMVERVAASGSSVLILGETGVGKDLAAQLIHELSPRASGPFVRVSCVDLAEIGADEGFLARARNGTVHLDEVGGLSPRAQLALAHILEDAPGAAHGVRFVASTNHDLAGMVAAGSFRKDLYFRLNQVTITVPPLRLRPADVVPLAELFLAAAAETAQRPRAPALSPGAMERLSGYGWPGNVRELRNVIERAMLLSSGDTIGVEHLPQDVLAGTASAAVEPATPEEGGRKMSLKEEITLLEKKRILEALRRHPTQRDAALALEMPMRTFLNRLDALGIPRARGGGSGGNKE